MAVLAADLGGTRIKLGVVEDGAVIARTAIDAHSDEGLRPQLPRIASALREIAPRDALGLGIAFPSLVDGCSGRITRDSGKYRDAVDVDLKAWSEIEFGLSCSIENDARMACIGEWRFGAAKGFDDVVTITLGTGIGTGVIIGGQVLRGKHGQAGCLGGHIVVDVDGHRCPCGAIGCAEAEASTAALPALARQAGTFEDSLLSRVPLIDYSTLFDAARLGDSLAISLRSHSLDVWGALAVSLVHAYDPEIVVLGGGVLAGGEEVLGPIRHRIERDAWMPWGKLKVVKGQLGDDAALLACEWLIKSRPEAKS